MAPPRLYDNFQVSDPFAALLGSEEAQVVQISCPHCGAVFRTIPVERLTQKARICRDHLSKCVFYVPPEETSAKAGEREATQARHDEVMTKLRCVEDHLAGKRQCLTDVRDEQVAARHAIELQKLTNEHAAAMDALRNQHTAEMAIAVQEIRQRAERDNQKLMAKINTRDAELAVLRQATKGSKSQKIADLRQALQTTQDQLAQKEAERRRLDNEIRKTSSLAASRIKDLGEDLRKLRRALQHELHPDRFAAFKNDALTSYVTKVYSKHDLGSP